MYECVACMYVCKSHCDPGAFRNKASGPLGMKLQAVVHQHAELRTEPWFSVRATDALNHGVISPTLLSFFLKKILLAGRGGARL